MKYWRISFLFILLPLVALPETEMRALARETFERANAERRIRGVAPCVWSETLATAAEMHSQDMAERNSFEHESPKPGQRTVEDRVVAAGGARVGAAENIFWAGGLAQAKVPKATVEEWMASSAHSDNLLNSQFLTMGIGIVHKGREFWVTQVLTK